MSSDAVYSFVGVSVVSGGGSAGTPHATASSRIVFEDTVNSSIVSSPDTVSYHVNPRASFLVISPFCTQRIARDSLSLKSFMCLSII